MINKNVYKKIVIYLAVFIVMTSWSGCQFFKAEESEPRLLKISANPWIGYTPLFYLDRTGELKKLGFELRMVHSLGDSPSLMSNGLVDAFAATQYELLSYREELPDVVPIFTIDRSAGADKIHSNLTIKELRNTKTPIQVFMEIGSVNQDLFYSFIKKYHLTHLHFHFHNDPQNLLAHLQYHPNEKIIVVSYEPFCSQLEQKGIPAIASSKNLDAFIIDAFFTRLDLLKRYPKKFERLKQAFWRAKKVLDSDPHTFYHSVYRYLNGQSYESFLKSLKGIEWLPSPSPQIKAYLQEQKIEISYLP